MPLVLGDLFMESIYMRLVFLVAALSFTARAESIIGGPRHPSEGMGSWNPMRLSEGYVLGVMSSHIDDGYFIHTLEGKIKLGHFSSMGGPVDGTCVKKIMSE